MACVPLSSQAMLAFQGCKMCVLCLLDEVGPRIQTFAPPIVPWLQAWDQAKTLDSYVPYLEKIGEATKTGVKCCLLYPCFPKMPMIMLTEGFADYTGKGGEYGALYRKFLHHVQMFHTHPNYMYPCRLSTTPPHTHTLAYMYLPTSLDYTDVKTRLVIKDERTFFARICGLKKGEFTVYEDGAFLGKFRYEKGCCSKKYYRFEDSDGIMVAKMKLKPWLSESLEKFCCCPCCWYACCTCKCCNYNGRCI